MGESIIKVAPDRDLYLIWSSVVDNAVWVGDRRELAARGAHEYGARGWRDWVRAMIRADRTGGSDRVFRRGRWDDKPLRVMEGAPVDRRDSGYWTIARDRLPAYAEALLADDEPAGHALMVWEPWE